MTDRILEAALRASRQALELKFEFWFWGEALAFDAAVLAAELADDAALRSLAEQPLLAWSRDLLVREPRPEDVYAPLAAMLHLHSTGSSGKLLDAAVKVADYIAAAPTDAGALLHHLVGYPPMVFVDFIYYVGPYLQHIAKATGEIKYSHVAVQQTIGHLIRLQDPANGLLDHVYDPARATTNGVAWGRGNGWALLGLVDILSDLPDDTAGYPAIKTGYEAMVKTCLSLQEPEGSWHTILDDPASPLENSVAAFFSAAFMKARKARLLDHTAASAAEKAWNAVTEKVLPDGKFPTSMTEWPDWDPLAYYRRPTGVNPWGQGCFVRAVVEKLISS